ncbi:MAG: cytochrome P450 [bacterium]
MSAETVKQTHPFNSIPGPGILNYPGLLLSAARHDPSVILRQLADQYGEYVRLFLPQMGGRACLVSDPDGLETILESDQKFFHRPNNRPMKDFQWAMGDGLMGSEGDTWRRQHRLIMPMFHGDSLNEFGQLFVDEALRCIEKLQSASPPIDLLEEMKRLTIKVIGRVLFSRDVDTFTDDIRQSMETLRKGFKSRANSIIALPRWLPHLKINVSRMPWADWTKSLISY